MSKLDCLRIAAETTSVDTEIQFSRLSHCVNTGTYATMPLEAAHAWHEDTGLVGCCDKAVALSPLCPSQPTQWARFSSVGG